MGRGRFNGLSNLCGWTADEKEGLSLFVFVFVSAVNLFETLPRSMFRRNLV